MQRGNRESTIQRKLKYFNILRGAPDEMVTQILCSSCVDKSKKNALDMVYQYAEFLGVEIKKTRFRVYDNKEMYVPNPEKVKQF